MAACCRTPGAPTRSPPGKQWPTASSRAFRPSRSRRSTDRAVWYLTGLIHTWQRKLDARNKPSLWRPAVIPCLERGVNQTHPSMRRREAAMTRLFRVARPRCSFLRKRFEPGLDHCARRCRYDRLPPSTLLFRQPEDRFRPRVRRLTERSDLFAASVLTSRKTSAGARGVAHFFPVQPMRPGQQARRDPALHLLVSVMPLFRPSFKSGWCASFRRPD